MKNKRGCEIIRVVMFPRHTNSNVVNGKAQVFGAEVMALMDIAAGAAARTLCRSNVVTITFEKIIFKQPVFVGDLVECHAQVTAIGKSSLTIKIVVHVIRENKRIRVTEGESVFVAIDAEGKSIPVIGWNGKRPRKIVPRKSCQPKDLKAPAAKPPNAPTKA
jgi:acyl-CoA thioesterase YciA